MKIVTNEKYVARNQKIGKYFLWASLAILGVGLYMSFQPSLMLYSYIALLVGFVTSQVSVFYTNRIGVKSRVDHKISAALKGLDNKFTLYHFATPVSHLLVGPAGIWVIMPYHQAGTITYDEKRNRWKQKGGNFFMKLFAQESIGRPDYEVKTAIEDLDRYLIQKLNLQEHPPVQAMLAFYNPNAETQAENAPHPTVLLEKAKDFFRRVAKENPVNMEEIKSIQNLLPDSEE
ncbi:MAG: NERD domain-containing protein [Chloroflexi bacterium]|nr:NERD domain-containing protein [Chloroflexota bacterium]